MPTFWIVVGVVVGVLVLGAWLYDRRWSFSRTDLPSEATRADHEADAWRSQQGGPPATGAF